MHLYRRRHCHASWRTDLSSGPSWASGFCAQQRKIGHEINPDFKIGCMMVWLCRPILWHLSLKMLAAREFENQNYLFSDIHARGNISLSIVSSRKWDWDSSCARWQELLAENTVDFISFSYYMSVVAAHDRKIILLAEDDLLGGIPKSSIWLAQENGAGRLTQSACAWF